MIASTGAGRESIRAVKSRAAFNLSAPFLAKEIYFQNEKATSELVA